MGWAHHEVHLLLADGAQARTCPMQQLPGGEGGLAVAGGCKRSCLPYDLPAQLMLLCCHLHIPDRPTLALNIAHTAIP